MAAPTEEQQRKCAGCGVVTESERARRFCTEARWGAKLERRIVKFTAQAQWMMWVVSDFRAVRILELRFRVA